MTSNTMSQPIAPPHTTLRSIFLWLVKITEPNASVPREERQRVRTLLSLTLSVIVSAILLLAIYTFVPTGFSSRYGILTATTILFAFPAFWLGRTKYYHIGISILVYGLIFLTFAFVFIEENSAALSITIIPIFISAGLFSARNTTVNGIGITIIATLTGFFFLELPIEALWIDTAILLLGTMFISVVIVTRDSYQSQLSKNIVQLNAAQESLRSANDELKTTILEVQQAREQAERADQVKSAFLASMSHELRTPLNAVINFTKFVAKGDLGPVNTEQEETLTEVIDSAKHLLNLINDVLDMSKIESGTLTLFIEDNLNLKTILDNAISTGRALLKEKSVTLQSDIPDELPVLRGDRQRILQIFLNILSNACKFTDEGTIHVQARQNDDEVIISVKDTGHGIAPEDQPLVFEAFKQTKTGIRQGGGTGLGMPISKNLVESHGGRLWLESEPEKGSTFHVALPIKSEQLKPISFATEGTKVR